MKPLRQRNRASVGAVALVLIAALCAVAFSARSLPIIGEGTTYSAYFSESAGLTSGNQVQVAGVKVGEVRSVSLDGDRVRADFTAQDVPLGERTSASIEIRNLLGEKYIKLRPQGEGELSGDEPIPVKRTDAPYDIPKALDDVSETAGQIDTEQLAGSFRTISETFQNTPQEMRGTLQGLSALSDSLAKRDEELRRLVSRTADVSDVVAERKEQVSRLVQDGNRLLEELQKRQEVITSLLSGTERVSEELRGLVRDNQQELGPTLDKLERVSSMLQRNQDSVANSISALAPYVRVFNNTVGNGRWFDGYLCGLLQSCEDPSDIPGSP